MIPPEAKSATACNPETQQLLLDYAIKEIECQGKNFEHFDRKTGLVLGFALISIAQMVTVLIRLTAEDFALKAAHPHVVLTLVFVGLGCIVAAVVCGIVGLIPRTFYEFTIVPEMRNVTKTPEAIRSSVLTDLDKDIERNEVALGRKYRYSKATYILVTIALCSYVIVGALLFAPLLSKAPVGGNHDDAPLSGPRT